MARWTAADYRRDASAQQAEHDERLTAELRRDRDDYLDREPIADPLPGPLEW
jgi:hypothetical protein